jgi:hypothetical protein
LIQLNQSITDDNNYLFVNNKKINTKRVSFEEHLDANKSLNFKITEKDLNNTKVLSINKNSNIKDSQNKKDI